MTSFGEFDEFGEFAAACSNPQFRSNLMDGLIILSIKFDRKADEDHAISFKNMTMKKYAQYQKQGIFKPISGSLLLANIQENKDGRHDPVISNIIPANLKWCIKDISANRTKNPEYVIILLDSIQEDYISDGDTYCVVNLTTYFYGIKANIKIIPDYISGDPFFDLYKKPMTKTPALPALPEPASEPKSAPDPAIKHEKMIMVNINGQSPPKECIIPAPLVSLTYDEILEYISILPVEMQYEDNMDWFRKQIGSDARFTILQVKTPGGLYWAICFLRKQFML